MLRLPPALLLLPLLACGAPRDARRPDTPASDAPRAAAPDTSAPDRESIDDPALATVPESSWIRIDSLTLIGFYPVRSNEQLDADEDLATALDDFSYHLGTAMDSLRVRGVAVHLHGGDTLWLRTRDARWRWVRPADSADIGYVLVDSTQRQAVLFGVRSWLDLPADVDAFRRGTSLPR